MDLFQWLVCPAHTVEEFSKRVDAQKFQPHKVYVSKWIFTIIFLSELEFLEMAPISATSRPMTETRT